MCIHIIHDEYCSLFKIEEKYFLYEFQRMNNEYINNIINKQEKLI